MNNNISKQDLARIRNWNKARILGFIIDMSCLTKPELEIVNQINILKRTLIECWDTESSFLGLNIHRFLATCEKNLESKIITRKDIKRYKKMGYTISKLN